MRSEVTVVPVEYDDDVKQQQTRPLLLPNLKEYCIYCTDNNNIEKVDVVAVLPAKHKVKTSFPNSVKVFHARPTARKLPKCVLVLTRVLPAAK